MLFGGLLQQTRVALRLGYMLANSTIRPWLPVWSDVRSSDLFEGGAYPYQRGNHLRDLVMKSILILPLLLLNLFTWTLGGCDLGYPGDREDCDGHPYVANNVLPDTVTLQLDGPPFRFDLSEAPIFEHAEGKLLSYRVGVPDADSFILSVFLQ